jgi:FHA domain
MPAYTIGSEEIVSPAHIIVVDPSQTISGRHAKLTVVSQNELWIEELPEAKNGTYVNNQPVRSDIIKRGDAVRLAQTDISEHIERVFQINNIIIGAAFQDHWKPLKAIYEKHQADTIDIKKKHARLVNSIRGGVTVVSGGVTWLICHQFGVNDGAKTMLTGVGGLIGLVAVAGFLPDEKLQALNMRFQQAYVCPACLNSLNSITPDLLLQNGHGCNRFRPF